MIEDNAAVGQALLQDSLRTAPDLWRTAYRTLLAVVNNSRNTQDPGRALAHLLSSANEIERAVQAVADDGKAAEVTGVVF